MCGSRHITRTTYMSLGTSPPPARSPRRTWLSAPPGRRTTSTTSCCRSPRKSSSGGCWRPRASRTHRSKAFPLASGSGLFWPTSNRTRASKIPGPSSGHGGGPPAAAIPEGRDLIAGNSDCGHTTCPQCITHPIQCSQHTPDGERWCAGHWQVPRRLRWMFTDEEQKSTPSVQAGYKAEKEQRYRQEMGRFVQVCAT